MHVAYVKKNAQFCRALFNLLVMITREVINALYKQYSKQPESADCLDMALLFDAAAANHGIRVDMDGVFDELVIESIEATSPFHRLPMSHIHAIVPFEEWVAIALNSSIIFLNRNSSEVKVHIRDEKGSFLSRLGDYFRK